MATYKEIGGFNIKSLASDPANPLEGEMWYNSTSGTLKVYTKRSGSLAVETVTTS
jgi:hypothetical protein